MEDIKYTRRNDMREKKREKERERKVV